MNTWKKIKEVITKDSVPNSLGYSKKLILAADLFMVILNDLKNKKAAEKEFNEDSELTAALLNRGGIEELYQRENS